MLALLGLLGPQGLIIAALVAVLGSAGTGAYAMHRWDNATTYYKQTKALEHKLAIERQQRADDQKAREADDSTAQENSKEMERLQNVITDITSKIGSPSSVCFSTAESNQLRRLWKLR